jgi:hypothetical protein
MAGPVNHEFEKSYLREYFTTALQNEPNFLPHLKQRSFAGMRRGQTVIAETPKALSAIWSVLQMPDKASPFRHDGGGDPLALPPNSA